MSDYDDVVQCQFGVQVLVYLSSVVYVQGEEFVLLCDVLVGCLEVWVFDLGCGVGYVSFQVVVLVGEVVVYDFFVEMFVVVVQSVVEWGMVNICIEQGKVESLFFVDGEFDFVFSCYFIYYWCDVGLVLCEVWWVFKFGGVVIFVDVVVFGQVLLDIFLQIVELFCDISYVCNYLLVEWVCLSGEVGLLVIGSWCQCLCLEFQLWVEWMCMLEVFCQVICSLQLVVGEEVREYFEIVDDGLFSIDVLVLWLCWE